MADLFKPQLPAPTPPPAAIAPPTPAQQHHATNPLLDEPLPTSELVRCCLGYMMALCANSTHTCMCFIGGLRCTLLRSGTGSRHAAG